jgi:hypothetical protein
MKTRHSEKIGQFRQELGSPASVERFRILARTFTAKAASSKAKALSVLKNEGIVTGKGNLTKRYSVK